MVKSRFTTADVRAAVRDLRGRVLGLRVVNVYDINEKTYLIKLANPGMGDEKRVVLLLESGLSLQGLFLGSQFRLQALFF